VPDKGSLKSCCLGEAPFSEMEGAHPALLAYILEYGVDDPNVRADDGSTVLHDAVRSASRAADGSTVLHDAVRSASLEMCRSLLDSPRFTAVDARFEMGEIVRCYAEFTYMDATALHLAAATAQTEICKLLLEDKRVNINAKSRAGYTALHFAVAQRNLQTCQTLLQFNEYDVNAVDGVGMSALELAVACCFPENEKYELHDLTDDGRCWSSSHRLNCREEAERVCELLMQSARCNTNTQLQRRLQYAKSQLESDRLWHTRILSVTARYSSGEVACVLDVSAVNCVGTFLDLVKAATDPKSADEIIRMVSDCQVQHNRKELWSVFDSNNPNFDVQLLRLSDFRALSPDETLQAEADIVQEMLSLTDLSSGSIVLQDYVPSRICDKATSLKFSETDFHIIFNTPAGNPYWFDLETRQFFGTSENGQYVIEAD